MLDHEWPNVMPSATEGFLESGSLRDGEVTVEEDVLNETRAWAGQQVEEIKRRIFPYHGIK